LGTTFLGNVIRIGDPDGSPPAQTCVLYPLNIVQLLCVNSVTYDTGYGLVAEVTPFAELATKAGVPAEFTKGRGAGAIATKDKCANLFKDDRVIGLHLVRRKVTGEPRRIADVYPRLPAEFTSQVDAVAIGSEGHQVHMFKDDTVIRYDLLNKQLLGAQPIEDMMPGLPHQFTKSIAATGASDGTLLLFTEDRQGIFYDTTTYTQATPEFRIANPVDAKR